MEKYKNVPNHQPDIYIYIYIHSIWRVTEMDVLQNRLFIMENPMKMDDLGGPPF